MPDKAASHRGIVDAIEREHAALVPMVERVDAAFAPGDSAALAAEFTALRHSLSERTVHEEDEALALVERPVGQAGWDAFGTEIRERVGGMAAGARYLPWVLDAANEQVRATTWGMLPLPVRMLDRRVWEPKYRVAAHL